MFESRFPLASPANFFRVPLRALTILARFSDAHRGVVDEDGISGRATTVTTLRRGRGFVKLQSLVEDFGSVTRFAFFLVVLSRSSARIREASRKKKNLQLASLGNRNTTVRVVGPFNHDPAASGRSVAVGGRGHGGLLQLLRPRRSRLSNLTSPECRESDASAPSQEEDKFFGPLN